MEISWSSRKTSVWNYKGKLRGENILPNGYFDFSKIQELRAYNGKLLRKYRKLIDKTQKKLGNIFNINRIDIDNWERNNCGTPVSILFETAKMANISKEQVIKDLEKTKTMFSMETKPFNLPFKLNDLNYYPFKLMHPIKNNSVYFYGHKELEEGTNKVLNSFLSTFFEYEKEALIKTPLTALVSQWNRIGIDLLVPISVLFVTEGSFNHKKTGLVFINNSKMLHDILVDCIYFKFKQFPTSYFRERKRKPKNSTFITSYTNDAHYEITDKIVNFVRNIKTAPHEDQSIKQYLMEPQPNLDFILNKNNGEQLTAFRLFMVTEGSIYITTHFGYVYPVFEIASAHPDIVKFLEKLSDRFNFNFKENKSKRTWSGLKGVRARGIAISLKILKNDLILDNIQLTSKSKYFEGFNKKDLLLAILELRRRQDANKKLLNNKSSILNKEIQKILKTKAYKDANFYIEYFSKKGKVRKWL